MEDNKHIKHKSFIDFFNSSCLTISQAKALQLLFTKVRGQKFALELQKQGLYFEVNVKGGSLSIRMTVSSMSLSSLILTNERYAITEKMKFSKTAVGRGW
jgi:hypothetical protein